MALGTARLGPAGKIRSRTLHGSARLPRNAQHFETVVDITITPAWSRSGHLVFFLSYELHSPVLDDFPTNTRASTYDASYDPSIFHNHDSSPATICNLRHAALFSCRISGALNQARRVCRCVCHHLESRFRAALHQHCTSFCCIPTLLRLARRPDSDNAHCVNELPVLKVFACQAVLIRRCAAIPG